MIDIGKTLSLGLGKQIETASNYTNFYDLISIVLKNIFIITGIILFFFIVFAGIGIILNTGNPEKQKKSSQTLTSAVLGFVIIFASYWIILIIEKLTGIQIFNP